MWGPDAVAAEVYKDGRQIVNNINQTVNYAHDLKKHYKKLIYIAEKLSAGKEDIGSVWIELIVAETEN